MTSTRRSIRLNIARTKMQSPTTLKNSAKVLTKNKSNELQPITSLSTLNGLKENKENCKDTTIKLDRESRPCPLSKKNENKRKTETETFNKKSVNISPTKIKRCDQLLSKVSPSRLIDRLSLANESNSDNETQELKEIKKSQLQNKYQNARRVLNSAETENLPGREEQLKELQDFLLEHLNEEKSGSLYVSGQPGTGKTACLSLLLHSPEFIKRFQCAYVNCTSIASINSVYKKLCLELGVKSHGRTERDHLEALTKHFCSSKRMNLIVLDEIDQLCSSRHAVLYTIFEWPALEGAKILLVGIANSLDLTDRVLVRLNARVELKPRLIHFPAYTKQQLVNIFKSRLEQANVLDIFPPVTIQLLAAKVSALSGDIRKALDIGRRVIELAEQQKRIGKNTIDLKDLNLENVNQNKNNINTNSSAYMINPIKVTQVVEVLNNVYGASQKLDEDLEESFPLQQKLMICTLMLMLRIEKNKDITVGRMHEVYRRVCKKRNISALDQAEFFSLIDLVETRGILRIIRKKELRLSKVQLLWDEAEVNSAISDKQLIATILNDTGCLNSKV